jgi:hypothetical protein
VAKPTRREVNEQLEYFLATGGSTTQLKVLSEIIATAQLTDQERYYFELELLPMVETAFYAAVHTRRRAHKWASEVLSIGAYAAGLNIISTTPLIPDDKRFLTSAVTAVALLIQAYIQTKAKYHQPEMSHLISRKIVDGLLGEATHRLTGTGEYVGMSEEDRFTTMASRCKDLLAKAENQSQEIIKSTLTSPYNDKDNKTPEPKIWIEQEKINN